MRLILGICISVMSSVLFVNCVTTNVEKSDNEYKPQNDNINGMRIHYSDDSKNTYSYVAENKLRIKDFWKHHMPECIRWIEIRDVYQIWKKTEKRALALNNCRFICYRDTENVNHIWVNGNSDMEGKKIFSKFYSNSKFGNFVNSFAQIYIELYPEQRLLKNDEISFFQSIIHVTKFHYPYTNTILRDNIESIQIPVEDYSIEDKFKFEILDNFFYLPNEEFLRSKFPNHKLCRSVNSEYESHWKTVSNMSNTTNPHSLLN